MIAVVLARICERVDGCKKCPKPRAKAKELLKQKQFDVSGRCDVCTQLLATLARVLGCTPLLGEDF